MYEFKKSVHFAPNDALVKVHNIDSSSTDPSLYVSCQEFEDFKEASFKDVSLARKHGFGNHLEGTFVGPTDDVQKRLNSFVRNSEYRGVERWICESHLEERRLHRIHAIRAILISQDMAKKQGLKGDDLNEQLRQITLLYSLDAKVFARRLGKADEAACYPNRRRHCGESGRSNLRSNSMPKTCTTAESSLRLPLKQ